MLATTIANHYASGMDQHPAALKATVRAVQASERVQAFGEAAHLAERALELWARVRRCRGAGRDGSRRAPEDHSASARDGGDWSRGEVLLKKAVEELDPERDRVRYSALLARLGRAQWRLNRGREGPDTFGACAGDAAPG